MKKSESPEVYITRCPSCQKQMKYDSSNSYRPFCSKACKTEDLASWAQEEFRVKGAPANDLEQGSEDSEED